MRVGLSDRQSDHFAGKLRFTTDTNDWNFEREVVRSGVK